MLESILESSFGIVLHKDPAYATKSDGTVDEKQVLGEEEIKLFIKENTAHYSDDNLESDVASVVAIHKLRNGALSNNIESSGYVFVTNNSDFVHAFNKYYKENVEKETFQLAITVNYLSAITWIKCGEVENVSESALLKNAYCAMQPIPEILSKLEEVLTKMKASGQIKPEQVVALRSSRVFQNDLWRNSFGDISAINEHSVVCAQKKYEEDLIRAEKDKYEKELEDIGQRYDHEMRDIHDEFQKKEDLYQREIREASKIHAQYIKQRDEKDRDNYKNQLERIRHKADQEAKKARERWLEPRMTLLTVAVRVLVLLGIGGLIVTFTVSPSAWISVLLWTNFILSVVSAYDTVISRESKLKDWILQRSYQYETKIREMKIKEYSSLLQTTEELNMLETEDQIIVV